MDRVKHKGEADAALVFGALRVEMMAPLPYSPTLGTIVKSKEPRGG